MKTTKTWSQLEGEIRETFRKWGLLAPTLECALSKQAATKRNQTERQRGVLLRFIHYIGTERKEIKLGVSRYDRAIDNLAYIAKAVEQLRLVEMRGQTEAFIILLWQLHPGKFPQRRQQPESSSTFKVHFSTGGARPSGPYAVLHIAGDAPLEVAEAAYRALAKTAHPDHGGTLDQMKSLNAAIEQIRKERGR